MVDFIVVFFEQLFGTWVGLFLIGMTIAWLFFTGVIQGWVSHFFGEKDKPDLYSRAREFDRQKESENEQKESLLRSIRSGEYGQTLLESIEEIEKELNHTGKRTVSFEEAIFMAQKYGEDMSINERGEMVIHRAGINLDSPEYISSERLKTSTSKGWHNVALDPIPEISEVRKPQTLESKVEAPKPIVEERFDAEYFAKEAEIKAEVMKQPWFRYCKYFNGETDGAEWKRHPTYFFSKYRVLEAGGIEIITPYGRQILERGCMKEYETWESIKLKSDKKKKETEEKEDEHIKANAMSEALAILAASQSVQPLQKIQPIIYPSVVISQKLFPSKTAQDLQGFLSEGAVSFDFRRGWSESVLSVFAGLVSGEKQFLYTANEMWSLTLPSSHFISVLEGHVQVDQAGQFAQSFENSNGGIDNDILTPVLDSLNKFIKLLLDLDLAKDEFDIFLVATSSNQKRFGVRPMIMSLKEGGYEQFYKIDNAVVLRVEILRSLFLKAGLDDAMSQLGNLIGSPRGDAKNHAFGLKAVQRFSKKFGGEMEGW